MNQIQSLGNTDPLRAQSGLIIGNTSEHGLEFVQLAMQDYKRVFVAGPESSPYPQLFRKNAFSLIQQELGEEDMAQNIFEEWEMFEDFEDTLPPLGLLVNLLEFNDHDPWEDSLPQRNNPSLNVPQLIELNERFFQKMALQGSGEILNVISRPADCPDYIHEMFQQTQALLMEIADELNHRNWENGVHVHTLSYSPQSFVLQTDVLPARVAHDLVPKSCSARDIAGYGYQVLQARRGTN